MARSVVILLILCLLAPAVRADQGNGVPLVLSFSELPSLEVLTIDRPTTLHLPSAAELLVVEEYQPPTDYLEAEIRAYRYQQTFFWLTATAIMVYVWFHR